MEPYIGQIMLFAGNFAPRGWERCDGKLLPISQNSALFSILGTMYGGDGVTTFALPDLRGRAPINVGNGPGLSAYTQGQKGGSETVTLTTNQIPSHAHTLAVANGPGNTATPSNNTIAGYGTSAPPVGNFSTNTPAATASAESITHSGGGQAHNNLQPYLALNYVIAVVGIYPSRS